MKLDPYQEAARTNQDAKVLLVAPPGSGKTTVLLAKIDYLIEERAVLPERILVLTFSRSASDNMKSRHQSLRTGQQPVFGTLHAFAWQEIRKRRGELHLISQGQAMTALQAVRRQYFLSAEEIHRSIGALSRERATGKPDETFPEKLRDRVRRDYSDYKTQAGLVDFDDLEDELLALLMEEAYVNELHSRFAWIMVDEFQDLNPKQIQILKILAQDARVFCVGDEDQCIYAFRGSDSSAMVHFGEIFPGGRILYLRYNYRCSATIVRHANDVIRHNQQRYAKEIINFRQDESQVQVIALKDDTAQLRSIVKRIQALAGKESLCMILRTNAEIQNLAQALIRRGIRFSLLDRLYNRYDKSILRQILNWLDYAVGERPDRTGFLKMAPSLPVHFPPDSLAKLKLSRIHTEWDLLDPDVLPCPAPVRADLIRFFGGIDQIRTLKPRSAIRYALYVMGYHRYLEAHVKKTGADLRALIDEVEELAEEAGEFPSLSDFLAFIRTWDDLISRQGAPERILLSTMHGVKGMEFDEIVIANACDGFMPHERSLDDLEAERRLFYVAVTRAKDRLCVFAPRMIEARPAQPSRFLKELGIAMEEELDHPGQVAGRDRITRWFHDRKRSR